MISRATFIAFFQKHRYMKDTLKQSSIENLTSKGYHQELIS